MNDVFSIPSVVTEMEPQPHGGALKRQRDSEGDLLPLTTAKDAQDLRMRNVPEIYKTKHEQLACELALGMEEPDVVMARYGYEGKQAIELTESAPFTAILARVGKEIRENGLSFRTKAKALAEALLPHAFDMATDPLTSSAVRATLIQWVTKVAGLEPKESKEVGGGSGGLNLSITFAGQAPVKVVGNEPLVIEG